MSKALIVDDELYMRNAIEEILKGHRLDTDTAENGESALKKIEKKEYDIILSDIRMPGTISGIDLLKKVKANEANSVVIMMTAYGSVETAVEAMKSGAFDYIQKPFSPEELRIRVDRALKEKNLSNEVEYLRSEREESKFEIIGESTLMKNIKSAIGEIAKTDFPVLITGESGTGKELVARQIHYQSDRKQYPFIAINVSNLNPNLIESELFGYEKGAFTGAQNRHKGKFELADQGTLFLDEIGELPLEMQSKLLRVLQEKEFYRVGGNQNISTNARIVAATNKNLPELIKQKVFREDLYYRLNVYPISIPPLRERTKDIQLIIEHLITKYSKQLGKTVTSIDDEVIKVLKKNSWNGNVRELENIVIRILIKSAGETITLEDLPLDFKPDTNTIIQERNIEKVTDLFLELAHEKSDELPLMNYIETLLAHRMFNKIQEKQKSAEMLGISKPTFFKWYKRKL